MRKELANMFKIISILGTTIVGTALINIRIFRFPELTEAEFFIENFWPWYVIILIFIILGAIGIAVGD